MQRPVPDSFSVGDTGVYQYYLHIFIRILTQKKKDSGLPHLQKMHKVPDVIYAGVLPGRDFPAGFKRLQNSNQKLLNQFRSENAYISFGFENPNEAL